ncbi:MAG TPA: MipA/OmpV family protein [Gammaproteobacteria bacterium]|nr:MipA/OmpV family protein [Gammaproteobacteria bacterium]
MRTGFAFLLACIATPAFADAASPPPPQPTRVDFGLGVGAVDFPAYEGAAEKRQLVLPFPYFSIRSRFLDADRDQVRGKLLRSDRWSLDMDFGGNVDVTSSDTKERQGMPDLDWLGEVGPALRYHVWQGGADDGIDFVLPARVAASVRGVTFHHRGFDSDPRLVWHATWFEAGEDRLILDANVSGRFVDRGYAQYYYGVSPQYATAARPAYEAPGGYAGWSTQLGVSWHRGDMVYGAFVEHTSVHGAAFQSSPLVGDAGGWSFGLAVAWVFQRSQH